MYRKEKIKIMGLRVAIIGMGKMGRIRMQELDSHPGFEVVCICDLYEDLNKEFPDLVVFSKWEEVLTADLDVVFVCTYNNISPDIVCAALEKGCHVFCEKPPGRSVADVKRIMQSEKLSNGRVLKFGFNHRFHYAIMEAKSIVDSGRYGNILCARGIYGKAGGLGFEKDWRADKDIAGGGILLDQGIHMLDLMRYLLGDFVDVKSFVENLHWDKISMEDNAFVMMKTKAGKVATVHSSATQWKHKFNLDVFMENGYLSVNGLLTSTRSYGDESITFAKKQFEDEAQAFGRPREETIFFDRDDSWKLENDEFYNCITEKIDMYHGNSEDALKVMQLVEKIYKEG